MSALRAQRIGAPTFTGMRMNVPAPAEIKRVRTRDQLSQTDAAALIWCSLRAWQQWEAGDRDMHPAFWELFTLKANELGRLKAVRAFQTRG